MKTRQLRNRIPALLAVAALVTGLAACANDTDDFADFDDTLDQAVALPVDAPRITIGQTGTDPQMLAYRDIDNTQDVTVSVSDGFNQTVTTAEHADPTPPAGGDVTTITLPLDGVTNPADDPATDPADDSAGSADSADVEQPADRDTTFRVGQPQASDLSLVEELRSAEGFRFGWRATNDGQVSTVRFAAPTDASDEGRSMTETAVLSILALPVIFPAEPIGVGGIWSVDSRVAGASTLLQTTTYTITSIDGDTIELDVEVTQRPALGALSLDGVPGADELADDSLDVLSSTTITDGALTVDLTQPLPVAGSVAFTTRVVYGGSDDIRVVQDTTTALAYGPDAETF